MIIQAEKSNIYFQKLWKIYSKQIIIRDVVEIKTYQLKPQTLKQRKFCHSQLALVDLSFTTLLTSQINSVAFYSEREKSDKFISESTISAWGSFTLRKSTTRFYFPFEGSHT